MTWQRSFGVQIRTWTRPRRLGASLLGAILITAGCGGGESLSDGDRAMTGVRQTAPVLIAQVSGCAHAVALDSGNVVYVRMDAACSDTEQVREVVVGLGQSDTRLDATAARLSRVLGHAATDNVLLPGLGVRQVHLVQQGRWRELPNLDQWRARDGAGLLLLNGSLYLLGGWLHGPVTNEVWKTEDLVHWQFLGYAPWPPRHASAWLTHAGRLWVIGGDLIDDVWSSLDGVTWTQESTAAPFGRRYTPNAASIGGEIVVYAGQDWAPVDWCHMRADCQARSTPSVWKSPDGRNWRQVLETPPWQGRALIHGSAVFGGEIYLIGGGLKVAPPDERYAETVAEYSDIWSSPDGVQWTRRADTLGFSPRTHFSVLATAEGCFVSDGSVGSQDNFSNELFFAPDCLHFGAISVPANMLPRHASSFVAFNGSLVLLGGPPGGGAGNSVWQYFP